MIGPPSLEFAPYNKIPSGRVRHDGRQGTIDQDPEFIDFLQSLTEPITKASANEDANAKQEKVTITPLIQYIKEKKANKAKEKEAAATKASKKGQDGKDAKNAAPAKTEQTTVVKKATPTDAEKARVAKATQQAVDSIKRSVAEIKGQGTPTKQEQQSTSKASATPTQPTPKRERQRGDASAAARIIGRDLGLVPREGRPPRTPKSVATPANSTDTTPTAPAGVRSPPPPPVAPPSVSPQPQASPAQPPTGPRNLRNATPQPSPLRPSPIPQSTKPAKPPPQPSAGAKSAFLKHANPSQGVTEELLRSTFAIYGTLTRCEIDKKKGLGYIDFTENEGLRKAMAASPIKVGNGNVVVLENRSPYKKAPQAPRPNTASPITSTASSPHAANASLASVAEQSSRPVAAKTQQAPTKNDHAPARTAETSAPSVGTAPSIAESTPPTTPHQSPAAPRGGAGNRANARGNFRGRGYRGRGGQFGRGGNRAVSTPIGGNSAPSVQSAPNSPAGGDVKR